MKIRLLKLAVATILLSSVDFWCEAAPYTRTRLETKAILEMNDWWFVTNLAFSPDSKLLASTGGKKGVIRLWDVAAAKVVAELPHPGSDRLVFSPNGKMLASWNVLGGRAKTPIWVWDVASRKRLAVLRGSGVVQWMFFSPDGKEITACEYIRPEGRMGKSGNRVVTWSVEKQEEVRSRQTLAYSTLVDGYPAIKKPLMIGMDVPLFRTYSYEHHYELREATTGEKVFVCKGHRLGLRMEMGGFAIDRAETTIASLIKPNTLQVWDRATGENTVTFRVQGNSPLLSPEAHIVALVDRVLVSSRRNYSEAGLRLYEVPSGNLLEKIDSDDSMNLHFAFSPDGRLLATTENTKIKLWTIPEAWRKKKERGRGRVSP